ncbi:hypothetical protein SUGI_0993050 [Cryptomeria japonica]|nr:hypothetical protein SUGI_0993050 [Cryptomeria japonica]
MATSEGSVKGATHWKKLTVQEMQSSLEVAGSKPSITTVSQLEILSQPSDDSSKKPEVESEEFQEEDQEAQPVAVQDNVAQPGDVSTTVKDLGLVQSGVELGSDLEKKQKRAERFGVSIQMSEDEKRKARAARFGGISSDTVGTISSGVEEEKKRKARAERFGLPASSVHDEEAKKKARMERFGMGIKCDSAEVEKREARAARFGLKSSNSTSDCDGLGMHLLS